MNLNQENLACVARPRRLLNHYDPAFFRFRPALLSAPAFAEVVLDFTRWDDFHFETASFKGVEAKLRMLVSDEASEMGAEADRIERGLIRRHPYVLGDGLWTVPLTRQTAAS